MGTEPLERKLAAILYADVAGYSRLSGEDEEGTHRALRAYLAAITSHIQVRNGRVVHYAGDAVLAEFGTVSDALSCAVDVQRDIEARNQDLADDRKVQFRIGVNLGEVILDQDEIYGDGVNVAARLEGLAEPGGICISEAVRSAVGKKLPFAYEFMGEQSVKNIAEPVRAYRVLCDSTNGQVTASGTVSLKLPDKPAIAVLPLTNMSGDPEQEYFADGLTEDLITALGRWRSFPVIARNSTFVYKNKAVDAKQVARELRARYLLEGSVRKYGNRVRVTVRFIEGEAGHHVWAERYERDIDDIFALQDEITQHIAATLAPELERTELKRSSAKRPSSLDAWDYYLRGMACINEFTKEGNVTAREMFAQAIALDPNYSEAYMGLAMSHNRDLLLQCVDDPEGSAVKALDAARRAVELDSASSYAHQVLSTVHIWRDEHDLALVEARLAVELNPNDAVSLHALGNKSDLAGDPEGIPQMVRAQQLNPQDPERHSHLTFLARAYVNAHQYEQAVECARLAIQRRLDYPHGHYILAIALGHLGRTHEARAALDECERLSPGFVASRADWRPYTDEERNRHLRDGLRKAGLQE